MKKIVFILTGGAVGAIARYLVSGWFHRLPANLFPIGTVGVNCMGSFLFGFVAEATAETTYLSPDLRSFIFIGFLGSFTTFSTFAWELFELLRESNYYNGALYFIANVGGSLFSLLFGIIIARLVAVR